MRAIWSLWMRPMLAGGRLIWHSERAHWLSWILSVETARRHYPELGLVADSAGARVLVDELGLEFHHVSIELDALDDVDPAWWAIGKLFAYRAQQSPFVHIDPDVYLWKRLPAIVEHAPVFAQSPEPLDGTYDAVRLHALLAGQGGAPEAWTRYLRSDAPVAACCGILGGHHLEFLQDYAALAIRVALHARYRPVWEAEDRQRHMVLIEQYLLCACVEHWNERRRDGQSLYLQYLFPAGNLERASEAGFTHLVSHAKRRREAAERIETVVRRDYPEHHRRCLEFLARSPARRTGT